MDSWSRPTKSQATPPPLYLTAPDTKYCHTCGRMIGDRKSHKTETSTPAKYCSAKCRSQKPRDKDRLIENAFAALLNGETTFDGEQILDEILETRIRPKAKGERRIVVPCSVAETLVFGSRHDPTKVFGRRKNRATRALDFKEGREEWTSVDMADEFHERPELVDFNATGFAGKVRPPQRMAEVNGSVGGEKGKAERELETEEDEAKRLDGQRVAEEKELVKRAARRCVVFGMKVGDGDEATTRLCEAVMSNQVVEPSYAKGDWGIRWREA